MGQDVDIQALRAVRPDAAVWMVPVHKLHFPLGMLVADEVILVVNGQRKTVRWEAKQDVTFFLPVAVKVDEVRDVVSGQWVSCVDELDPVHPLATVGQVQEYLCERFFRGKVTPMITVGGRSVAHETLILAANCVGVLQLRMFPLSGGGFSLAGTEEKLRDLLKEHSVEEADLTQRVSTIVEKMSYEVCKRCLDSRTPWTALKMEATKHNLRWVTVLERESKTAGSGSTQREEDPLVANDPWQGATFGRSKKAVKASRKDVRPVRLLGVRRGWLCPACVALRWYLGVALWGCCPACSECVQEVLGVEARCLQGKRR